MGRWLKRLLTLVLLIIWFLIMLFPCMAFSLATRTEIEIGSNVRIFLVSEETDEGVGVEWKRPFSANDQQCEQTAVNYFMWTGEGDNASYCQCTDTATGEQLPTTTGACQ
jgi:hypothetical protein